MEKGENKGPVDILIDGVSLEALQNVELEFPPLEFDYKEDHPNRFSFLLPEYQVIQFYWPHNLHN